MKNSFTDLDQLCINAIRTLSIDAIDKASSGHPGLPLGAAPMAYVLWSRHLKFNPEAPQWEDRDRFVLSAGHGSMLLYSLLHLSGYSLGLEEIKNFRQLGSLTPGHPEFGLTDGVEATTGPLGQGSVNAVGMAVAERKLAKLFNSSNFEAINHYTYAIVSDGDLMEGLSAEAASLAGQLGLGKLIYLYDSNDVTLDGPASLCFSTEDVAKRYESYGWQVLQVKDGDQDLDGLNDAIESAKQDTKRPSIVIVKTTIGYGSPNRAGTSKVHGAPLGEEENKATKKNLGWKWEEPFFVPDDVYTHFKKASQRGKNTYDHWRKKLDSELDSDSDKKLLWSASSQYHVPSDILDGMPTWGPDTKPMPTRKASGSCINYFAPKLPWILGGDADLGCSTNTVIKDGGDFEGQNGSGQNVHYGVREHAMAAIANGMGYHGGVRPFVATFFCFADYMRPSIRLAAMTKLPPIYVWTHDSIGLGEDGPTHQPVEHLASLRAIPNLTLIRPCDANETSEAWKVALSHKGGPLGLVLTRQALPVLAQTAGSSLAQGAYVLYESPSWSEKDLLLIATGSEVHPTLGAAKILEKDGTPARVVSMPSWGLFDTQDASYKDKVLPRNARNRIAVEAGVSMGWEKWVGTEGVIVSRDEFGLSAPASACFEQAGFTPEKIAERARTLIKR